MANLHNILVVSGHVGASPEYIQIAQQNHFEYCDRHGYQYFFDKDSLIHDSFIDQSKFVTYSWLKVFLVLQKLQENKWSHIFWIDSDSIFWNFKKDLTDLVAYEKNLVFTGDSWDVFNTGHFLIKNSEWSRNFMQEWSSMRSVSIPDLHTSHKGISGRLVDQPAANILLATALSQRENLKDAFNAINGYVGNPDRHHKWFQFTHAPTHKFKLGNTQKLVNPRFRSDIRIVQQDRLNGYPFALPGKRMKLNTSDILHFPGESKHLLKSYSDKVVP